MKNSVVPETGPTEPQDQSLSDRRSFLRRASLGAATAFAAGSLLSFAAAENHNEDHDGDHDHAYDHDHRKFGLTRGDVNILIAAEIAEALAVTTYTNIINSAPFFGNLPADDQAYLTAALQEEMSHYALEASVTKQPTPFTKFYYPKDMFSDAQTTLNVLVSLEDAFIAAYLVGVRHFSMPDLRVTAARIMGIESDHRTLARVLGSDVAGTDGGPLATLTGFQGVAESVDPPNNNGYERTLCLANIGQAVKALTPFADPAAAAAAGFDTSKSYAFQPFTPTLPINLGDFISFAGC
jgi:hypothetical protein